MIAVLLIKGQLIFVLYVPFLLKFSITSRQGWLDLRRIVRLPLLFLTCCQYFLFSTNIFSNTASFSASPTEIKPKTVAEFPLVVGVQTFLCKVLSTLDHRLSSIQAISHISASSHSAWATSHPACVKSGPSCIGHISSYKLIHPCNTLYIRSTRRYISSTKGHSTPHPS